MSRSFHVAALGLCVAVGTFLSSLLMSGEVATQPPPQARALPAPMAVPYFAVPTQMQLCGEAVPLTNQDVVERFDREFTIVVYSHAQVYLWLKRMERYFPWLERQLAQSGLPDDLKYVAVAESDLVLTAVSHAGAVGPWQFIASTGSNYGLSQTREVDERQDFERATESAFKYLRELHGMFQSWSLAMAAYNCGERRVQDELRKQRVSSYYSLKLPLETERYVFRILAIKEVLSHPERYGYSLPKGAGYPPVRVERVSVSLPESLPLQLVAEAAGITYRDFRTLNPAFLSDTIPDGSHTLKVPEGRGRDFEVKVKGLQASGKPAAARVVNAPQGSSKPAAVYHKVKRGETLSGIASHYGVSQKDLREWNGLQGNVVRIGQTVRISK